MALSRYAPLSSALWDDRWDGRWDGRWNGAFALAPLSSALWDRRLDVPVWDSQLRVAASSLVGDEKPADAESQHVLDHLREDVERAVDRKLAELRAVTYVTQVAAGTKYSILAHVGSLEYVRVHAFRELSGFGGKLSLVSVDRDDRVHPLAHPFVNSERYDERPADKFTQAIVDYVRSSVERRVGVLRELRAISYSTAEFQHFIRVHIGEGHYLFLHVNQETAAYGTHYSLIAVDRDVGAYREGVHPLASAPLEVLPIDEARVRQAIAHNAVIGDQPADEYIQALLDHVRVPLHRGLDVAELPSLRAISYAERSSNNGTNYYIKASYADIHYFHVRIFKESPANGGSLTLVSVVTHRSPADALVEF